MNDLDYLQSLLGESNQQIDNNSTSVVRQPSNFDDEKYLKIWGIEQHHRNIR